jgi:hypothetical protein
MRVPQSKSIRLQGRSTTKEKNVKKLLTGAAIAALSLGTLAGSMGVASAAPSGRLPLDEGTFNRNACVIGICQNVVWTLGANHVMTDSSGFHGSWNYNRLTHALTVIYASPGCTSYNGTGTPEKGFSGSFSGCLSGTFTATET